MFGRLSARAIAAVLLVASPAMATPPLFTQSRFMQAVDAMMAVLAPESARSAATIRELYQDHLNLLMLDEYTELTGALDNGGLVPVPDDPIRYNVAPRLAGTHPIGEKD